MNPLLRAAALLTLIACAGCSTDTAKTEHTAPTSPPSHAGGIDLAGMDRSTAPGDDFFTYTNGAWFAKTEIPPDRSTAGTWTVLGDLAQQRTRELVENLAKPGAAASPDDQRSADYFTSYMDETAIEAKGIEPIKPFLAAIAGITDRRALSSYACGELRADVDALNNTNFETDRLFGVWVSPALDEPARYAPYLLQGGLGLPDRDYYLETAADMQKVRDAYRAHMTTILRLAGIANPDRVAGRAFALETRIAGVHATRTQSVDVQRANNPWPRAEFATRAPGIDWNACFAAASLDQAPRLIVWHPEAVKGISALVASEPVDAWRGLPDVPCHQPLRGTPPEGVRGREFRVLRQGAVRHRSAAAAVEAGGRCDQRRARRSRRRAVCASLLSTGIETAAAGDGEEPRRCVRQTRRGARLDGSGDQGRRPRQTRDAAGRHRVSGHVARLLGARRSKAARR